ncbi:MAG: hypothetical protein ACERKO_00310, partial [Acetanaerobacterium sp.]
PQRMLDEAKAEQDAKRAARKNSSNRVVATVEGTPVEENLSQKELDRRRLAEARRRDAERYGEVYVDVTEDDLK